MYFKQKHYKVNTPVLHFLLHPGCKEGVITSVFSCKDGTPHNRKSGDRREMVIISLFPDLEDNVIKQIFS